MTGWYAKISMEVQSVSQVVCAFVRLRHFSGFCDGWCHVKEFETILVRIFTLLTNQAPYISIVMFKKEIDNDQVTRSFETGFSNACYVYRKEFRKNGESFTLATIWLVLCILKLLSSSLVSDGTKKCVSRPLASNQSIISGQDLGRNFARKSKAIDCSLE